MRALRRRPRAAHRLDADMRRRAARRAQANPDHPIRSPDKSMIPNCAWLARPIMRFRAELRREESDDVIISRPATVEIVANDLEFAVQSLRDFQCRPIRRRS